LCFIKIYDLQPYFLKLVDKKSKKEVLLVSGQCNATVIDTSRHRWLTQSLLNKPLHFSKVTDPKKSRWPFAPGSINDKVLKGKITVLNFWYHGCGPCAMEIKDLNKLYAQLKDDSTYQCLAFHAGPVWYDTQKQQYLFCKHNYLAKYKPEPVNYHFPQYSLTDAQTEAIGINSFPVTLVIDRKGIVREVQCGYSIPSKIDDLIPRVKYFQLY
jgi:hypothetical protein